MENTRANMSLIKVSRNKIILALRSFNNINDQKLYSLNIYQFPDSWIQLIVCFKAKS